MKLSFRNHVNSEQVETLPVKAFRLEPADARYFLEPRDSLFFGSYVILSVLVFKLCLTNAVNL